MPIDIRKMDFEDTNRSSGQTAKVMPTADSMVDYLSDPLDGYGMSTKDKLKEAGSAMLGKTGRSLLGVSDVGTRRAERAKAMLDDFDTRPVAVRVGWLRSTYASILRDFMVRDQTIENLDFLEAVDGGESPESVRERFIEPGAPSEINLKFATRTRILGGGHPKEGRGEIIQLIGTDVWSRLTKDAKFLEAVRRSL